MGAKAHLKKERSMEVNVGGLKWAAISFVLCLLILSFAEFGRLAFWLTTVVIRLVSYQIGSLLLLRRLRREIDTHADPS
jgi:hypothetical protein